MKPSRCESSGATARTSHFRLAVFYGSGKYHEICVMYSELLKDLVELCLVGKKTGTRRERLPSGAQADGRLLAQVFVPLSL
jgi:hypothetical protein